VAGLVVKITLVSGPGRPETIGSVGLVLATFALPASMGVAILRYRLYDIDRLISRTLGYAIVTGLHVWVWTSPY
jgi:hypothetical protein